MHLQFCIITDIFCTLCGCVQNLDLDYDEMYSEFVFFCTGKFLVYL